MKVMKNFKYLHLGASIYVPSNRNDLISIVQGVKFKARSIIFCTEDSILESEVSQGIYNIQEMLSHINPLTKTLFFIRVRNIDVLKKVLDLPNINRIAGFVFPKITADNFAQYMEVLPSNHKFSIMPTLETKEVFSFSKMVELVEIFNAYKKHILTVRIGGNDLMNIIGIRRPKNKTIYETPIGNVMSNLIAIFKSEGYNLTSPVYEFLYENDILLKELSFDLSSGLFGKTAIHPEQIPVIESFYKVSPEDLEMSIAILDKNAKAVFNMHGTMCEVATHYNWAEEIHERAKVYGVMGC